MAFVCLRFEASNGLKTKTSELKAAFLLARPHTTSQTQAAKSDVFVLLFSWHAAGTSSFTILARLGGLVVPGGVHPGTPDVPGDPPPAYTAADMTTRCAFKIEDPSRGPGRIDFTAPDGGVGLEGTPKPKIQRDPYPQNQKHVCGTPLYPGTPPAYSPGSP